MTTTMYGRRSSGVDPRAGVVGRDVALAARGQQLVALLHLARPPRPAPRAPGGPPRSTGALRCGRSRVGGQLDALEVDQDQPHLVGRGAHQQAGDERVDAHALARAGRAGDQQVGHPRQVDRVGLARHVAAERERELAGGVAHPRVLVAARRKPTISDEWLGISMPTTSRPGMGASMRMERAASAMARSSARPSMRDSLTRASGLTSYWVTTGPVLVRHDRGRDLEAAQLLLDDADVALVVEAAAPLRRRRPRSSSSSAGRSQSARGAEPALVGVEDRASPAAVAASPAAVADARAAAGQRPPSSATVSSRRAGRHHTVWLSGAGLGIGVGQLGHARRTVVSARRPCAQAPTVAAGSTGLGHRPRRRTVGRAVGRAATRRDRRRGGAGDGPAARADRAEQAAQREVEQQQDARPRRCPCSTTKAPGALTRSVSDGGQPVAERARRPARSVLGRCAPARQRGG